MAADYTRIHRLLKILTLIQGSAGWSAERLAEECGVTVRTIYRDMKSLEGAGIPYYYDDESRGYRVRGGFFMPPVDLTFDEALALVALGEHVGAREQIPMLRSAGRAIAKVRSVMPGSLREELEQLDAHMAVDLARSVPEDGVRDVYEEVRSAIARRRVLLCRYESIDRTLRGRAEEEPFELRPYALLFSQRAWYVIGHHGGRGELRSLKLNRFSSISVTKKPYSIPDEFTLEEYLGNAWRMIRGKRSFKVELHFDAGFAETIAETHWHRTQDVQWNDDGSITFTCTVDGLDEILWWVLGMGPHCVVTKPKELAERVQKLARGVLERYEERVTKRRRS